MHPLIHLALGIASAIALGAAIGLLIALAFYGSAIRELFRRQSDIEIAARKPDHIRIKPPVIHCNPDLPPGWRE